MTFAGVRSFAAVVAAFLSFVVAPHAGAEYRHRVVVVDVTGSNDATTAELLTRVRGELTAAGFEVVDLTLSGQVEPKVAVETAGSEYSPAAVLAVRHGPGPTPGESLAELWVSDRLAQKTLMQRARFADRDTSSQTARLAVQVVELLKARLAALWVDAGTLESAQPAPKPPSPPPPVAERPPAPPAPPASARSGSQLELGAGLGLLRNFGDSVGSAWAPALRFGVSPRGLSSDFALGVRATAALTPDAAELSSGVGLARVRQAFILAEGYGRLAPSSLVSPLLSVGLGAFSVSVAGQAPPPYTTRSESTISALSSVGAGLWIQPANSVAWILEGQLLAAWSETSVVIDSRTVGSVGWPMAFFSTSILGVY
jgi:hypothetical protein